jgi:hypothetical protein
MRRLRLALILPPLQLAFAVVAVMVFTYQSRGLDAPDDFLIWQLCCGVNAPARFAALILGVFCNWLGHGLERLNNVAWGEFYFFVGVVLMWFVIGYALDRRQARTNRVRPKPTVSKLVINVILLSLGTLLFIAGVQSLLTSISMLKMPRATVGRFLRSDPPLVVGIFFLLWSFVLIVIPGRNLREIHADKRVDAVSP